MEREQRGKQTALMATAALSVLLALVFAFFPLLSPAPVADAPVRRFTLQAEGTPLRPSISPNGRHVAYLSGSGNNYVLWVQDLDRNQPRAIAGPGDLSPTAGTMPFWSPDSQFVSFRSAGVYQESGRFRRSRRDPGGSRRAFHAASSFGRRTANRSSSPPKASFFKVPSRGGQAELWLEAGREGFFTYDTSVLLG